MSTCITVLITFLLAILAKTDGHFNARHTRCLYGSEDLHDMLLLDSYIFNQVTVLQYNSTVGKFNGYTKLGIKNAERMNNDSTYLAGVKGQIDSFCKYNAKVYYPGVYDKTVEPTIEVQLLKKSDGSHPAMLMCSAYNFYPPKIDVTWLRDGKEIEGGVTSTEEMPDGDWYYQIHSHLEYMPKSGEEITCVVHHASSSKPIVTNLGSDSESESDRSKIAIGASGLVLGLILSAAGFFYYKKKSSGRILVPT